MTANVLETKVPDTPDLEMDVLHRFSLYYERALAEEIDFLTGQYQKVVDSLIWKLPPGKRERLVGEADRIIREIATGDKPFVTQQDMAKILKMYM